MTGKQIRNYGIALVVVAVLALLLENPFGGRGGGSDTAERFYRDFSGESIDRIEVVKTDETVKLVKRAPGDWVIEGDYTLPADTSFIHNALRSVADFSNANQVSKNPEKHGVFQVDAEQGVAVQLFAGGDVAAEFVLGKNAQNGGTYYRIGSDEVFLSSGPVRSYFVKGVKAWRDRRMFNIDPAELVKLTYERGDSTVVFESDADLKWYLRQPEEFEVTKESVVRMLSGVGRLIANDIADSLVTADVHGLDEPMLVVRAETLDGRIVELIVGQQNASGLYYATRGDGEWVYLLAKYRVDPFYTDLYEMRAPEPGPPAQTESAAGES